MIGQKNCNFPLGAMYWINPNYTQQQIDEDMRKIKQNNFSIIRSFIFWEYLEEKEGHFDFTMYDMLYEAAAKNGIKIAQSFGIYLPIWLKKRLKEKGITSSGRYFCLDIPDVYTKLNDKNFDFL
ncbi:beta-galactosidase, partial [bacterium]|nr:beta-galactosidase [bacterium]